MSHWTTIQTQLKELPALAAACAELHCQLLTPQAGQKVQARGWGGATIACDAAIRIPNCNYDVALNRQPDGSYSLVADLWSGQVSAVLGENYAKLKQLYGVHNTMIAARKMGHAVSRVAGVGGKINVVITGRM